MTSIGGIQSCEDECEAVFQVEEAMRVHEVGVAGAMNMSYVAHTLRIAWSTQAAVVDSIPSARRPPTSDIAPRSNYLCPPPVAVHKHAAATLLCWVAVQPYQQALLLSYGSIQLFLFLRRASRGMERRSVMPGVLHPARSDESRMRH